MFRYAQTNIQLYGQLLAMGYSSDSLRQVRQAYDLAGVLFSAQYRPNGKPFVCHLVGTASILAEHGGALPVVLAGLLHAAYAEGEFASIRSSITRYKRQIVRNAIGDDVENLIWRYTSLRWNSKAASLLVSRIHDLHEKDRTVVFMRIANELEEAVTSDILFEPQGRRSRKAVCLSYCSQLAEALDRTDLAREIVEVFGTVSGNDMPAELITNRSASYIQPPQSYWPRPGPLLLRIIRKLSRCKPQQTHSRFRR